MSDIWKSLEHTGVLTVNLRSAIVETYGKRGKKAIEAVETGKVTRFLDFFVVEGKTGEYVVEDDFCTCRDFSFRGVVCWHILAVRIAKGIKRYNNSPHWYQDTWVKNYK